MPPRKVAPGKAAGKKKAIAVKKVRSKHGTRVARSITCRSCGAKDTIHFAPKDPKDVLCRKCAAEKIGVADADANIYPEARLACIECGEIESTRWDEPETFVCEDCRAGIFTKQGDKSKQAERVSKKVLRKRAP
jgi:CxxC-x17-CxxC domain-containing protein